VLALVDVTSSTDIEISVAVGRGLAVEGGKVYDACIVGRRWVLPPRRGTGNLTVRRSVRTFIELGITLDVVQGITIVCRSAPFQ